jgi:DNA polymerase-3 subunit delta'
MSFSDFSTQGQVVRLLQRSLEQGRLAHAYLFTGSRLSELEALARTLAKTLNCQSPPHRGYTGLATDCCDHCLACRKTDAETHADVVWIRPESKLRQIEIGQLVPRPNSKHRPLSDTIQMKPTEGQAKVAVIVAADRLTVQAANAFLKTLEEPPANSALMLLTTEPQRVLETIRSRCLRLNFGTEAAYPHEPSQVAWLAAFAQAAAAGHKGLLGRYRLLGVLLAELAKAKAQIEQNLAARSPLERYEDADPGLREKWEAELSAAIEAEYRRQRLEVLAGLQWWLRDVWLCALGLGPERLTFPDLTAATQTVAARVSATEALDNLQALERTQRLLGVNVQEALALEVGLLKLKF